MSVDVDEELAAAIDGLYGALAGYLRPQSFLGCACCWPGEPTGRNDGNVVVAAPGGDRPLRQLTVDELVDIAGKSLTTAGTLEVLKHYLPRVLEIAAGEGFGWPDVEVVFGRLAYGPDLGSQPWTEWPTPEQGAIRRFLHAWWAERLAHREGDGVDEALCAIGRIDPDIDWYLRAWLRFDAPAAALNLHRFLVDNAASLRRGRLLDAHWSTDCPPAPENQRRVVAWTRADATKEAVARAADHARTPDEREALEESYLRWLD